MSTPYLCLSENLALLAGAGTGKTHGLISLALHLLGGARPDGEPLAPNRLFAVTFTEKAAVEMMERLRLRVRGLAEGASDEPELRASFAALARPLPTPAFWQDVRSRLEGAFVGTFHSLCAQILRRCAIEARLDPQFTLLEEGTASELFTRCAEEQLLEDLEGNGPEAGEARRLIRALGFQGQGPHGSRLLELLAKIHARLSEEGRAGEIFPEPQPEPGFLRARGVLAAGMNEFLGLPSGNRFDETLRVCRERLPFLVACTPGEAREALEAAEQLAASIDLRTTPKQCRPLLKKLRDESAAAFELACGDVLAAPLHRDFLRALGRVEEAYRQRKERQRVLDFADLIQRTRDLLTHHAAARLDAQERIGALLVDEFQDTNRLQLDLVALWCERREGAPREVRQSPFAELPLEQAMLACVGDRKQSIYEFRGADVSVFAEVADRFALGEGRIEYLRQSRRSRPALIQACNQLFTQVMSAPSHAPAWKIQYQPEHDDLTSWRPHGPDGPCVELIDVKGEGSEERRVAEARGLAGYLALLLSPQGSPVVGCDREGATLRRAEGGDVAILLRRFTHLELFRRELLARSIPHRVVGGGGFFASREVVDLRCLLALLGDPTDRLALCAVLRSPLVALSDGALARLALQGVLSLARLREDLTILEPGAEQERARAFLALFGELQGASGLLGMGELLEMALERLDLEAVLAPGFEGEQRIANLRKLVAWAKTERPAGPWAAARRLERLARDEAREAQASLAEESDRAAVRIMTIHQAKGLEFPVVFVPECGALLKSEADAVLFDRQHGLCVRPRGSDGRAVATTDSEAIQETRRSRQEAESERLFYVAATRARDLLVLSGEAGRGGPSWRAHLDRFTQSEAADALIRRLPAASLSGAPAAQVASSFTPRPDLPIPRAVSEPRLPRARTVIATVTELADWLVCPRKHFLAHRVGLESPSLGASTTSWSGNLERGSLAHRILQRLDFSAPVTRQVVEQLFLEGVEPEGASGRELIEEIETFASSSIGRDLARVAPERIWRETPFALQLGGGDGALQLRGTVDLMAVLEDGTALVIDYKHERRRRRQPDPHLFQLSCYALAVRSLLPAETALRTALVFLKERGEAAILTADASDPSEIERQLLDAGRRIGSESDGAGPSVLPSSGCVARRCGFLRQCHPRGS
jgi:ATP-dependent exoDNAse (exonuclease V) beta subunit